MMSHCLTWNYNFTSCLHSVIMEKGFELRRCPGGECQAGVSRRKVVPFKDKSWARLCVVAQTRQRMLTDDEQSQLVLRTG